jgi:hypothetical protein
MAPIFGVEEKTKQETSIKQEAMKRTVGYTALNP